MCRSKLTIQTEGGKKQQWEWLWNHGKDGSSAWKWSIWLKSRRYPSLYTLQYRFLNSRSLSSCMFPNRGFPETEESGDAHQNSHLANPKSRGPVLICLKSLSVFKWCACVCVGGEPAVQRISTWTAATGRFPFSGRIQTRKADFFHANVKFIQEKEEVCSLLNPTHTHTGFSAWRTHLRLPVKHLSLAFSSRVGHFHWYIYFLFETLLWSNTFPSLNMSYIKCDIYRRVCGGAITFWPNIFHVKKT